ncbi:hypothetical protein [Flavobacterium sp. N1736]|uniref:hypothetical protein n=1 Tax=Flavobacterium sp. N1736 TaxID=2986823 RepID=UPI0022249CE6|nr:hypothetical protein [Flavobacterium sp. N1736]
MASKAKANVSGATKKLENYVARRASTAATAASGTASTAVSKATEKKKTTGQ